MTGAEGTLPRSTRPAMLPEGADWHLEYRAGEVETQAFAMVDAAGMAWHFVSHRAMSWFCYPAAAGGLDNQSGAVLRRATESSVGNDTDTIASGLGDPLTRCETAVRCGP